MSGFEKNNPCNAVINSTSKGSSHYTNGLHEMGNNYFFKDKGSFEGIALYSAMITFSFGTLHMHQRVCMNICKLV